MYICGKKYTEKYTELGIVMLNCLVLFSGQHTYGKTKEKIPTRQRIKEKISPLVASLWMRSRKETLWVHRNPRAGKERLSVSHPTPQLKFALEINSRALMETYNQGLLRRTCLAVNWNQLHVWAVNCIKHPISKCVVVQHILAWQHSPHMLFLPLGK